MLLPRGINVCISLLGCVFSGALHAAASLPGVPAPPTPAPLPDGWIAFQDDLLGDAILNTDDFRTGGTHAGLTVAGFILAVDDSSLTNRGTHNGLPMSRTDEASYSLGYELVNDERKDRLLSWLVTVGGGGRTYGNLDGERVQNDIHKGFGFPTVILPYDPQHGTSAMGYFYARNLLLPLRGLPSPFPHAIGLQTEIAALQAGHEKEQYGSLSLVGMGAQGVVWAGYQYQRDDGTPFTPTSAIVANHEDGWWLELGMARTPGIFLIADVDPKTRAIDGNIGVTFGPQSGKAEEATLPVEELLEMYAQGGAIGAQLLWETNGNGRERADKSALVGFQRPDDGPAFYHDILVDYHFGAVPHYAWLNNRVDEDQVMVGYEPMLAGRVPFIPWLVSEEFIYGATGLRVERVEALATPSRFAQSTAATGVLQGGMGIRLGLHVGDNPGSLLNQLRLGFGWDGWLPWRRQQITNGSDTAYYLRPGASAVISLGFAVLW